MPLTAKVGAGRTATIRSDSPFRRYSKRLAMVLAMLLAAGGASLWAAYRHDGHTPGELMDYLERRLAGHPRSMAVALPLIAGIREWLDEPAPGDRRQQRFIVPPPPPLHLAPLGAQAAPATGQTAGRILRVGPRESIISIAEAARLARDGDTVEIAAGVYRADVATWLQKKLTIRAVGGNARLFGDGKSAEDKAIWVIRNGNFDISNIDFIEARVADRNGAGIRFENGHLRIRNCLFWGNENGILTAGGKGRREAVLEIENSEFAYNGVGDGMSHHLYVGAIAVLKVRGSYFHHANVGHLIKSRAAYNEITYNRLTDEGGGRASYELEFPNGGIAQVIGNIIQQNRRTENSTLISYGAEKYIWPENRLYLASNTLVNDHPYGGAFLRVAPGAAGVVSSNNLLVGKGRYHVPHGLESNNDIHAGWDIFNQAARFDYRLNAAGRQHAYQALPAGATDRPMLTPAREYAHARQTMALAGQPAYPGALQAISP